MSLAEKRDDDVAKRDEALARIDSYFDDGHFAIDLKSFLSHFLIQFEHLLHLCPLISRPSRNSRHRIEMSGGRRPSWVR